MTGDAQQLICTPSPKKSQEFIVPLGYNPILLQLIVSITTMVSNTTMVCIETLIGIEIMVCIEAIVGIEAMVGS